MKLINIYRILSFLLLPIAMLIAPMALISLLGGLANPLILLPAFILTCIVIYTWCSFRFLIIGIDQQRPLKQNLKDWLKVNAYVSIAFAALSVIDGIAALANPQVLDQALQQAMEQSAMNGVDPNMLQTMMHFIVYFLLIYGVLLLVHIILSLRLVKLYSFLFSKEK